jgi:hypothetical protein
MTQTPITPAAASVPHGEAYGGQQPVTGMMLQLYAVGGSGYGSVATGLFSPTISTDSSGNFSFPTGYCPSGSPAVDVYLVGIGGVPIAGATGGVQNPNLALMVALGPCNSLTGGTHIRMNELTTVAAVWALAPFMSGNTHSYLNVGTSSTNATGLSLAFEAASEVVNTSNGTFPGTLPTGATLPTTELNTIADILEACVNSKGGVENDGSACGTLFFDAPSGSAYPTDTITAAMNIAQNPANNVGNLWSIASATSAFKPDLGSAPNAWTVAITYSGGGLNTPWAVAADRAGNVWVANGGGSVVSWFDNLGNSKLATGTAVGGVPTSVAIDLSGNAWVTAEDNNLYELSSADGSILSTIGSGQTGFDLPDGVAIDPAGEIWVINYSNNTVSAVNSSGTALTGSPFNGAGINVPLGIAINGNAHAN